MSGTTIITQSQSAIGHLHALSEGLDTAMTNVIPPERVITNVTPFNARGGPGTRGARGL